jgi:CubicO group peptidase (beta-lactamase class C family)
MYRTGARAILVLIALQVWSANAAPARTRVELAAATPLQAAPTPAAPTPAAAALPVLVAPPQPVASSGAAFSTGAIDRYLRAEMRRQHIPGMSLAVVRDGLPVYVKSYGVATLEHPVPVRPQTVFQMGSIGKQFTAVAVMMLANEHKLDLDDPLSKYLPEVPASWSKVTLRLMLNHQSGIPQFTTPDRQLLDLVHDYSDDELIRLAAAQPLDFEPGTDVSYSDTGYVLLGFVINRVAEMFYGDMLRQRIFAPLGMTRTRIISDADIVPDRASGYEQTENGALRNQSYVSPALNRTADGSLYSTVLDLAKWDRALYGDGVLAHSQLERMWSVDAHHNGQMPLHHFGYGWENNRLRGQRLVEYDGNWQGFQAVMSRYVDRRLTVILMTNLALCRTERMGHTVAGLVDPALAPYPDSVADTEPRKTADFKAFLAEISRGDSNLGRLSAAARERLVPAAIHTLKRDLEELGPILRLTLAEQGAAPERRVYRVERKDMVEFFTVRYTQDSHIDDVELFSEY